MLSVHVQTSFLFDCLTKLSRLPASISSNTMKTGLLLMHTPKTLSTFSWLRWLDMIMHRDSSGKILQTIH